MATIVPPLPPQLFPLHPSFILVAPLQTATRFRNPLNSSALVAAGSAR